MTGGCERIRESLGAYVLGALDDQETAQVRAHLETCPDCRAEYSDLAALPSLLAAVPAEEAIGLVEPATASGSAGAGLGSTSGVGSTSGSGAGVPGPPDVERVLEQIRVEAARRRTRRRAYLLAAAAAVLVAGATGVAIGSAWPNGGSTPIAAATNTPNPRATAGPYGTAPVRWHATDPKTKVAASVTMNAMPWGTDIAVNIRGVHKGQVCGLVVYDQDGRRWNAGSWLVAYDGGARWRGGVAIDPSMVQRVEIFGGAGAADGGTGSDQRLVEVSD